MRIGLLVFTCFLISSAARPDEPAAPVPKAVADAPAVPNKPRPPRKKAAIELAATQITGDPARPAVEIVLPRNPSVRDDLERAGDHQSAPTR